LPGRNGWHLAGFRGVIRWSFAGFPSELPPLVFFMPAASMAGQSTAQIFTRSRATADAYCKALREREAKRKE
jgi:hypothetical protein